LSPPNEARDGDLSDRGPWKRKVKPVRQSARHPALKRLDALVGEWALHASFDGQSAEGGRTTFKWREDGAFLVQHADRDELPTGLPAEWVENSPEPVTTIIGLDDSADQFTMLYADARNVFRVYQMSLDGGVWRIWRDAPGFSQRFEGKFGADGDTITGAWEHSPDGVQWNHDFDLTYTKVT
jgi:hypothetical protein